MVSRMMDGASLITRIAKNLHLLHFTVSKVEDMAFMFQDAEAFDSNLNWEPTSLKVMNHMFHNAFSFNGDLSSWQPSKATNFNLAFWNSISFNKDVSTWSISSATNMELMFFNATSFNQNLCLWADDFPYDGISGDRSGRIFEASGCTNQEDPNRVRRGPFCATTVCP